MTESGILRKYSQRLARGSENTPSASVQEEFSALMQHYAEKFESLRQAPQLIVPVPGYANPEYLAVYVPRDDLKIEEMPVRRIMQLHGFPIDDERVYIQVGADVFSTTFAPGGQQFLANLIGVSLVFGIQDHGGPWVIKGTEEYFHPTIEISEEIREIFRLYG